MKILFLSAWQPFPPSNGSKLRIYNLLKDLSQAHSVSVISFADNSEIANPPTPDLPLGMQLVARRAYNPSSKRALLGLLNVTPRSIIDTHVPQMAECIRRAVQNDHYDLVIASQWDTAAYWESFRGIPAIFEELELGALVSKQTQATNPLQRLRHQLPLLKLRLYLRRLLPNFGACTIVSEQERALLRKMIPGYTALHVVPNGIDSSKYVSMRVTRKSNTIIFCGALTYDANYQAMQWFLSEVYSRIQAQIPAASLTITGDHNNLPLPPAQNVTLTGYVPDVHSLVASSAVSIAPLWIGGGTRLKILEAMALGSPVVATRKGVEGLDAENNTHLLIADAPEEFASAVVRLLSNPQVAQQMAECARQLVRDRYDWKVIMPTFRNVVNQVALERLA